MKNLAAAGRLLALSTVALLGCGQAANADLLQAGIFKNLTYQQTSGGVTSTGGFFNALAQENAVGDFDSASLTVNGGAPIDLLLSGTVFGNGPGFASKSDMDAAFPFGTYGITAVGGTSGPKSETINYTKDAYTTSIPALDTASYNALQGLSRSSSALTLAFNSFTPDASTTNAFTFFTIFGSNQCCGFLVPSSTSCTIDPSALTAGTTYTYELDFSDRVEQTIDGVLTFTDFDVRTDGTFTTAAAPVPEPLTLSLFGTGLAAAFAARRRKKP
jgi:hypothetical protein